MKRFFSLILSTLFLLGALASCGAETPAEAPGTSTGENAGSEASQTLEPITEAPETDPFEGAEPLPADLTVPENVKQPDGTVIGTIVLPAGADATETTAAEELRYHIEKVTGANLPVVGRPGEAYGSLIVCTPASLPAIAELFPDDLAWLADLGGGEESRWCPDGFAIRTLGKDIYIFGNISRGALSGAYDWIEENLGVLWVRADEELGLLYDEQPEVTALKTDYREKSPFALRGWVNSWGTAETYRMWSRNKMNWLCENSIYPIPIGQYIRSQVLDSPLYDPNETEYWNTDEAGNRLAPERSPQVNYFSEKTVEVLTAYCLQQLENGSLAAYIGEMEDISDPPYCRPDDTQPFEYAPGQFVNPEDEDYLTTVYWTFINRIARNIKEQYPDGKLGTYAYQVGIRPPRCEIEDNVLIWLAPINEDMCNPLLSQETKNKSLKSMDIVRLYCDIVPAWAEKSDHIEVYNYYGISRAQHQVTIPIWERMQTDILDYVRLGFEGVSSEGVGDTAGIWGADDKKDELFPYHSWTFNGMLYWIYEKLAWNPWEDVDALIATYCDRYYGAASSDMQEYYRLMKQGWDEGTPSYRQAVFYYTHYTEYYKKFIKPAGIGHPILDALDRAIEVSSGRIREEIQYMRDTFYTNISSFQNW